MAEPETPSPNAAPDPPIDPPTGAPTNASGPTKAPAAAARAAWYEQAAALERFVGLLGPIIVLFLAGFLVRGCVLGPGPQRWLGDRLLSIVNDRLVPELEMRDFRQDGLGRYVLEGIALRDGGSPLVEIHRVDLQLAAFPTPDDIRVASLRLDRPIVRLRRTPEGFAGFSPLLQRSPDATPDDTPTDADPVRPSETLELGTLEIRKGRFEISLGGPDAIIITNIDLTTTFDPGAAGQDGWHDLSFELGRGRNIRGEFDGRVNMDSALLQVLDAAVEIEIDRDRTDELPPLLRTLAERYGLHGRLRIEARGEVPLLEPSSASLITTVAATDLTYEAGGTRLDIDQALVDAALTNGVLDVQQLLASVAGGVVRGSLKYDLKTRSSETGSGGLAARFNVADIEISEVRPNGETRGLLNAIGEVSVSSASREGTVSITIEDGDLVSLPVISQIARVAGRTPLPTLDRRHDAQLTATLGPEAITLTDTAFATNVVAGEVLGTVGYDRSLRLLVKAGPLKKAARLLGQLGAPIRAILSASRSYRVTGTLAEPRVTLRDVDDPEAEPQTQPEPAG
ncbi:MAG: hypothetical protein AAF108_11615 [Planctomycetota bacterium]